MRVILFILGLLFSADGLYFASTTSMGVGEAFTVAMGGLKAICYKMIE